MLIRKGLEKQGYKVPNEKYISNATLAANFDIHKENRTFVITPERTATEKLLEAGFSALDILAILPSRGMPYMLAIKTSPITTATISNILKSLLVGARTKEITETFIDITRNAKGTQYIGEFEAQSAAILEQTQGVTLRGLKQGEAGDFAFESGMIGESSLAGKTIDQLGLPFKPEALKNFNLKSFTNSITAHFNKKGVDFILLDGRNMTQAQRNGIMDYIKANHSKDMNRLITIGFE